ncbi:MAG: hypothetical protein GQF41_1781 [Candidatus Rifleibacterium amylolyticum]|nr:MAG: hypothetical protein GQF41_1781 [Candidatus Rifleibacterium amylolyticum]NLF96634.1 hypothetical protein [Candidatus Riflebacteria bacterium]
MASAYTPGLKIVARTLVEKDRRLPLKGDVHVKKGDRVTAETVVASTNLPGNVFPVNIANMLGCEAREITDFLVKKEGDLLEKDDVIAETQGFFGFFKTFVRSPIKGTVESLSTVTGQAILREPPIPVEVHAYVDGVIDDVYPEEGVKVNTAATFIQGIFGIGPEVIGDLKMAVNSPSDVLDKDNIKLEHKGKIIVGGSLVTAAALDRAVELGVKGVIVGGYDAHDLKEFLGYDLGVAITGTEDKGITLVVTEGFGKINMAKKTFDLLKNAEGRKTSINGATQIRAGVIRPEVVIPLADANIADQKHAANTGMTVGTLVRIIRQPHFGEVAKVVSLPEKPVIIPSEAKVRVVEIETLSAGEKMILPRANVEIIEE